MTVEIESNAPGRLPEAPSRSLQALLNCAEPARPPHGSLLEALEAGARDGAPLFTLHLSADPFDLSARVALEGARRYAALLKSRGVKPGDRIPILMPTSHDFVQALLGTMLMGAVPAPLAYPLTFGSLDRYLENLALIVEDAEARCMLTHSRIREAMAGIESLERRLEHVLVPEDLEGLSPTPLQLPSIDPEDAALIQYTSGTTGTPKGAVISHRAAVSNAYAIAKGLDLTSSDVGVSWLPMFHDMGLVGVLFTTICHPYPVHVLRPDSFVMKPGRWLELLTQVGGTVSAAPNFAYRLCTSRIKHTDAMKLDCWRAALNGAEAVHPTTVRRFEERFAEVGYRKDAMTPVYGLAESTLAVTFPDLHRGMKSLSVERDALEIEARVVPSQVEGAHEAVSVGKPVAGSQVRIASEEGGVLDEAMVGEVQVRGPSLMNGYFRNEQATAATFADGWLRTGDLGFVHGGELFIAGRAKELIILSGRNLHPHDVERVVHESVGIAAGVAAFAQPNETTGTDDLVVVAETREQDEGRREALRKEIRGELLASLGVGPAATHFWPIGSLPRTTSGKIRRGECRRQLQKKGTMKRALVIGGTGFIGLNLVDALLESGVEVRVTRRRRSITAFVRKRPVELVQGSLEDPASLAEAMEGCDAVFLAAGHYPRYSTDRAASIELGKSGVRNACQAALEVGVPRFVYTSSTGPLGTAPEGRPADERDIPKTCPADSVYRAVKWEMEREVERAREKGLPVVTMLPGACLGPWDARVGTGGLLVAVVRAQLPWFVDGLVNTVDVGDVASAHVAAARHSSPADRYCLSGRTLMLGDLLRDVVRRYGGRMPTDVLDVEAACVRADAEEAAAESARQRVAFPREMVDLVVTGQEVSAARAERDLGCTFRPLSETLDRAHAWFVQYRYIPAAPAESGRMHDTG